MKVNGGNGKPSNLSNIATTGPSVAASEAKKTKAAAGSNTSAVNSPQIAGSASVDVSNRAQEMNRAKALATPSQSVDEAKVARLQALIDGGKYKVDSGAVADRLFNEHLLMDE